MDREVGDKRISLVMEVLTLLHMSPLTHCTALSHMTGMQRNLHYHTYLTYIHTYIHSFIHNLTSHAAYGRRRPHPTWMSVTSRVVAGPAAGAARSAAAVRRLRWL